MCIRDRAGAANVYLRSELGDVDWTELEEESGALLAEVLTDEEIDVLGPRIEACLLYTSHRGEDDQHVGLEVGRQLGARAVFVDDGRHTAIPAVLLNDCLLYTSRCV